MLLDGERAAGGRRGRRRGHRRDRRRSDADHGAADEVALACLDAVLLPGFVDTHVHINEPGTDWEGFATATAAAAAGGITTLVDMPLDSDPVTTTVAALRVKQSVGTGQLSGRRRVSGAGVVPDNLGELAPLAARGRRGVQVLPRRLGQPELRPPDTGRSSASAMARDRRSRLGAAGARRKPPACIADSPRPVGRGYASFLDVAARRGRGGRRRAGHRRRRGNRRPRARRARLQRRVLPLIADAKRAGVPVTAETCPHYLTFAAETMPDGGTEFAACPPIRCGANRDLLWAACGTARWTWWCPTTRRARRNSRATATSARRSAGSARCSSARAPCGRRPRERGFGLAELSRWMSERPAALAGLADRGRIAVGPAGGPVRVRPRRRGGGARRRAAAPPRGHARTTVSRCAVRCCRPGWRAGRSHERVR